MSMLLRRRSVIGPSEKTDASAKAEKPEEPTTERDEPEAAPLDLASVLGEVGLAPGDGHIAVVSSNVPPGLPEIVKQPAPGNAIRTVHGGEVLEKPQPDPQAVALIRQAEAAVAELSANPGQSPLEVLSEQVERVGAFIIRQMAELDAARTAVSRLTTDNTQLAEENRQMRELLKRLLHAVQADRRRANEAIGQVSQRLVSILPSTESASQPAGEAPVKRAS